MNISPTLEFSFRNLPEIFYSECQPTPVANPQALALNHTLARQLGISPAWLTSNSAIDVLAGNAAFPNTSTIATAYTGHQFGHLSPRLGDGRAHLLGELQTPRGQWVDIQLKGSGRTAYSRQGDGRSPLGPVLREYIVSEAMAAVHVPTSRSLAAIATGEMVLRAQGPEPGAILTRVASSHIRVGSFTYAALTAQANGPELIQALADYCLQRHFPDLEAHDVPYLNLLEAVIDRQAQLISQWMSLGFIHGVMNTDNMLICGETIDYGPCAFLDDYIPTKAFSFIDQQGRYRFENQPAIGQWNMVRLAEALLPIMADSPASALPQVQEALNQYQNKYTEAFNNQLAHKLGLQSSNDKIQQVVTHLLQIMADDALDYTLTFRFLMNSLNTGATYLPEGCFNPTPSLQVWIKQWQKLIAQNDTALKIMTQHNPIFIPRNHLVEHAITAAYQNDLAPFNQLMTACARPFDYDDKMHTLALPPEPKQMVKNTFCGT